MPFSYYLLGVGVREMLFPYVMRVVICRGERADGIGAPKGLAKGNAPPFTMVYVRMCVLCVIIVLMGHKVCARAA